VSRAHALAAAPLPAAIAAARGPLALDALKEMHCLARFGVGRETLSRIEAGEVVADAETEAAIRRGLALPEDDGTGPRGFFLVNEREKGWRLGFHWHGAALRLSIEEARALAEGISPLLAQYDRQFPR
jgi:transcriptional regulator with XRE-family HTH domain